MGEARINGKRREKRRTNGNFLLSLSLSLRFCWKLICRIKKAIISTGAF